MIGARTWLLLVVFWLFMLGLSLHPATSELRIVSYFLGVSAGLHLGYWIWGRD